MEKKDKELDILDNSLKRFCSDYLENKISKDVISKGVYRGVDFLYMPIHSGNEIIGGSFSFIKRNVSINFDNDLKLVSINDGQFVMTYDKFKMMVNPQKKGFKCFFKSAINQMKKKRMKI